MANSKRVSAAPPRKSEARKTLGQRAGVMATRLQEMEHELQGKISAAREAEIGGVVERVWKAMKEEMGLQRVQRALVVQVLEQEGDSLRVVEQKARMTGRPSAHDPIEYVRERLSLLPGAEKVLDITIMKAVSACARRTRGNKDSTMKWAALAELCVEIGLAVDDQESLRTDYQEWKRENPQRRSKRAPG